MGSPLATTTSRLLRYFSSKPGNPGSNGDGHTTLLALTAQSSTASWRALPTTTSASDTACRADGDNPRHPSAPMPTTVHCGSSCSGTTQVCLHGGPAEVGGS
jgi:hypothetical protein